MSLAAQFTVLVLHRTASMVCRTALAVSGVLHRLAQRITYRQALRTGITILPVGEYARLMSSSHPSAQHPRQERIVDPVERHEISDQAAEIIRRVFGEEQS